MATKNDEKIKALLEAIETKKQSLGTRPRLSLKTNGVITKDLNDSFDTPVNINTLNLDKCISTTAKLLSFKSTLRETMNFLELPEDPASLIKVDEYLDDIKGRTKALLWDEENKKLKAMEDKLKELRSVDAKTEDAIGDIAKLLK